MAPSRLLVWCDCVRGELACGLLCNLFGLAKVAASRASSIEVKGNHLAPPWEEMVPSHHDQQDMYYGLGTDADKAKDGEAIQTGGCLGHLAKAEEEDELLGLWFKSPQRGGVSGDRDVFCGCDRKRKSES